VGRTKIGENMRNGFKLIIAILDERYLDIARKTFDRFVERLPADKIPYWDFDIPNESKESSAAAITASYL
jgi:hypothetical protein